MKWFRDIILICLFYQKFAVFIFFYLLLSSFFFIFLYLCPFLFLSFFPISYFFSLSLSFPSSLSLYLYLSFFFLSHSLSFSFILPSLFSLSLNSLSFLSISLTLPLSFSHDSALSKVLIKIVKMAWLSEKMILSKVSSPNYHKTFKWRHQFSNLLYLLFRWLKYYK